VSGLQLTLKIMEKVKLTKVYITDKKKDGTALMSKYNKPYKKIAIITDKYGEKKWISGFIHGDNDPRLGWKEGDEVEITVTQNGDFMNFEIPKPVDPAVGALQKQIDELTNRVIDLEAGEVFSKKDNSPADVGDDLPF